jgi:hypothetical protein
MMKNKNTEAAPTFLWKWNWVGGGYNQCRAATREEALEKGNAMCDGSDGRLKLVVAERTLTKVEDERAFWANYPIFD